MTTRKVTTMISSEQATAMLQVEGIAVVGASDDRANFGRTIVHELRLRGHRAVAVHPTATEVAGWPCYPSLAEVPFAVELAIVMVGPGAAVDVARQCAELGIGRVWLFKGIGGAGAVSQEAIDVCEAHDIEVVAGACPLMFLEPVGAIHRIHRAARRARGAVTRPAA